MSDLPQFDLTGDLPTGTTLLEASAGTGKTFTVAHLVERVQRPTLVIAPNKSLAAVTEMKSALVINELEDVKNKLYVWSLAKGKWSKKP